MSVTLHPMSALGRDYWRLWTGSAASNLADGIRVVAYPWLASTLTREPALVAGAAVAARLPWLLLSLPVGALVDRSDRRRVMLLANALRLVLSVGVGVAITAGVLSLPLLYVAALGMGIAEVVYDNAAQTILPRLVPKESLERANGHLWSVEMVANEFAGPPLGGALIAVGLAAPFFADAGGVAVALVAVALIGGVHRADAEPPSEPVRRSLRAEIAEGVRWLRAHALLRTLAVLLGLMNLSFAAGMAVLVLFAQEVLGLSAGAYGLLLTGAALGGLAGAQLGPWLSRRLGSGTILRATLLAPGLASAGVAVTDEPVVVAALFAANGFIGVCWNVVTVSLRQAVIPDRLLGRVNSVYRLLGWGSMPVGAAVGGVMVSLLDAPLGREAALRSPFALAAAIHVLAFLAAARGLTTARIDAARAA